MVAPLQIVGRRGRSSRFSFEVSQKDIDRVRARLDKVRDKPMHDRVEKRLWVEADLLAGKVKSGAPRGPTGNLRRAVRARRRRRGFAAGFFGKAYIGDILIGPEHRIAPHRHLVIRGHRIVTPGGRYLGRRTVANPFVDRARRGVEARIKREVQRAWLQTL